MVCATSQVISKKRFITNEAVVTKYISKEGKTKLRSQNVHVRNVLFNYIIISIKKDKLAK